MREGYAKSIKYYFLRGGTGEHGIRPIAKVVTEGGKHKVSVIKDSSRNEYGFSDISKQHAEQLMALLPEGVL